MNVLPVIMAIVRPIFSIVWRILKFTGLVWLILGMFVFIAVQDLFPQLEKSTFGTVVALTIVFVTLAVTLYTLIQNLIRFFGVRFFHIYPDFKLYQVLPMFRAGKSESRTVKGSPEVIKQLATSEPNGFIFGRYSAK